MYIDILITELSKSSRGLSSEDSIVLPTTVEHTCHANSRIQLRMPLVCLLYLISGSNLYFSLLATSSCLKVQLTGWFDVVKHCWNLMRIYSGFVCNPGFIETGVVVVDRSERVSKTNVNGVLLTEARYINSSLHYLELVKTLLDFTSDWLSFFLFLFILFIPLLDRLLEILAPCCSSQCLYVKSHPKFVIFLLHHRIFPPIKRRWFNT